MKMQAFNLLLSLSLIYIGTKFLVCVCDFA